MATFFADGGKLNQVSKMIDIGIFPVVSAWMRRLDVTVFVALAFLMASQTAFAQGGPRSNVNLIGMTPDTADMPDLRYRQQNEPACAIRPGDSACIICAYNDYRAVDELGDAWEGVSQSCDAGDSWLSRLAPGHRGDLDAEVLPAAFAADPRLAAIPGMAILNFIAGYRDSNVGVLAIQHWLEVNKEDADHYEPGKITYFADTGTSGRFLDKPDMVAVLDPPNRQGTVTLATQMENTSLGTNGVITRDYPSGKLYVGFAVFTGSNSVKVLVKTSDDWGRTWANQVLKLSEDQNQVSGISLTAIDDQVLAIWRRKADSNNSDAIMYAVISNGGRKATKGEVLAELCPFDQPTLTGSEAVPGAPLVAFRTNDFPWSANDGANFYAFYSDRGRASDGTCDAFGRPRIVVQHSDASGLAWSAPQSLESEATIGNTDSFQFMPTAFGANGKVQVAWYDTRRETFGGAGTPWPFVADYNVANSLFVQRTVDVYSTSVAMGNNGNLIVPPPVRVSQFSIRVGENEYGEEEAFETEASIANKKLFSQGNAPFLGDYIAIAARGFRPAPNSSAWESNASLTPGGKEDFFAAWADNRDVRGTINSLEEPLPYGLAALEGETKSLIDESVDQMLAKEDSPARTGPPRDSTKTAEGLDGSDTSPGQCSPQAERTRDSNIYGSLIKDEFRLYATTPSKPLSGLKRAFALSLANAASVDKKYHLQIVDLSGQPCVASCAASFRQQDTVTVDEPLVPAYSNLARTVFIDPFAAAVKVEARELVSAGNLGPVIASIQLGNADSLRDPENCPAGDLSCTVSANETHRLSLESLFNANLLNPALLDRAVAGGCCTDEKYPTIGSVIAWATANLDPANAGDAALLNEALAAANLLNANLLNANLLNAALLNANLLNSSPTDLSGLDPALIAACSSVPQTVGDIIICGLDRVNANLLNANLLNAALLNVNLLNANLLNANLLNADLLNANLLNAALLNANLLNAALLNLSVDAAALLNANLLNAALLNADLLNANLLNPTLVALAVEGGCCTQTAEPMTADIISYALANPDRINAALLNAALLNAALLNANLLNANLLNANLLNANLLNADLLNANLLNANLLNANLLNANLLNADLLNADLLNASLLNESLLAAAASATDPLDSEVTYDDYTYPVTNNGNVNTAINADITINGEVIGTKLMAWTINATPTTVGCEDSVAVDTRVQSIVANPDSSLEEATIESPFEGEISTIAGPGETVFFTLRVIGTPRQLMNVRVSGFTAASQAADCRADGTRNGFCESNLRTDNEKILFKDNVPPTMTLNGANPFTVELGLETYVEPGATAIDNVDGDISSRVMIGGEDVLSDTVGEYTVLYNVVDSAGNHFPDTLRRIVRVQDTKAPVITLNGPGIVTLEAGRDTYAELGAGVFDLGNPGTVVMIGGDTVDTSKIGVYTVTYTATDGFNAAIPVARTVNVVDTTSPAIDPFQIPGDLNPNLPYPLQLAATKNSIRVTWPVSVTDADPNVSITCSVNNIPLSLLGALVVNGAHVTATFAYDFPVGSTTVTCGATDSVNPKSTLAFTVEVVDVTGPVIHVPSSPTVIGLPVTLPGGGQSFEYSYRDLVSVTDAVDSSPTLQCRTHPTDAFGSTFIDVFAYGDTTVECQSRDASGNQSTASFVITAQYAYDINLVAAKRTAKQGSTIPLDWQYLDRNSGLPVNSSAFPVKILWAATNDCKTRISGGMSGEDSGSSDFRYSAADNWWQYSWQTKNLTAGNFLVTVVPPGIGLAKASICITLK